MTNLHFWVWIIHLLILYVNGNYIVPKEKDIQTFLTVLENKKPESTDKNYDAQLEWGQDLVAVAGKLFQQKLKSISKDFDRVVSQMESEELPGWLEYDNLTNELIGIADILDIGKEFILITNDSHQFDKSVPAMNDVVSISVINNDVLLPKTSAVPVAQLNNQLKWHPIRCPHGSSVTTVTIVTNSDLTNMSPRQKRDLLLQMGKHLNISAEIIRLSPLTQSTSLMDSSALVAGPGDVTSPEPEHGAMIQWEVGCGNVYASHMPILQQVEETSANGQMANATGHGIVGWHVTNKRPQVIQRMKRAINIYSTPTLMPGQGPPTQQAVPTVIVDPYTRVVPSMASPDFPDEMYPSRPHHHRTKTKGRHYHHHTRTPKQSPHYQKTVYPFTSMPTATLVQIMPTQTIQVAPTLVDTVVIWPEPTYPGHSYDVSRTEDMLQPSMTVAIPPSHVPTEVLPTRTYIVTDMTSTEAVQSSSLYVEETYAPEPTTKIIDTTNVPEIPWFGENPILKSDLPTIVVPVGDILNFQIPENTFLDFEDGNTRNLRLTVTTEDGFSLEPVSWLQFNVTSQTLYGLPLQTDVGFRKYHLLATDSNYRMTTHDFDIQVVEREDTELINHEFSITLATDYNTFILNVEARIDIANRIARLYGDRDTSNVFVTNIEEGSVIYAWHNKTMQRKDGTCPLFELEALVRRLVTKESTVTKDLRQIMMPYFVVGAASEPRGNCKKSNVILPQPATTIPPQLKPDPNEIGPVPRDKRESDILITVIVPAVVLACMLLIACCIACCLYRRKRKGELTDEDQHTFINRGIPIIFADELEDKPEAPTKPLILREEKPPLPPPHYPQSLDSLPSSPESDKKDGFYSTDDGDDMMSPLYRPPPPLNGSHDRRKERTHAQPSYRRPPPYIPP